MKFRIILSLAISSLILSNCKRESRTELFADTSIDFSTTTRLKFVNLAPTTFPVPSTTLLSSADTGVVIVYGNDTLNPRVANFGSINHLRYSTAARTGTNFLPANDATSSANYLNLKPGATTIKVLQRKPGDVFNGFPFNFAFTGGAGKKHTIVFTDSTPSFNWRPANSPRPLVFEDNHPNNNDTSKIYIRFIHALHNDTIRNFLTSTANASKIDIISRRFGVLASGLSFGQNTPFITLEAKYFDNQFNSLGLDTIQFMRTGAPLTSTPLFQLNGISRNGIGTETGPIRGRSITVFYRGLVPTSVGISHYFNN